MKENKLPRNNPLVCIRAEDVPEFIKNFNENLPSQEFLESCRMAAKIFHFSDKKDMEDNSQNEKERII